MEKQMGKVGILQIEIQFNDKIKIMKEEVTNLRNQAVGQINEATTQEELERLRADYLGRKGKISKIFKEIGKVGKDERKGLGILINETKSTLLQQISARQNKLKSATREWFDPTLPGIKPEIGHLHLVTQAIEEISRIFERIGFARKRYREVEWDYFPFKALNFDENHPARDEWETFFIDERRHQKFGEMLLTPHTSGGQIREMERVDPPIRMINIAKCYRRQSDTTHVPMFHQFEGLVIDEGINIANLKGTIDYFAREFYGKGAKSRIRPYNFPFTEPSFEVDFSCSNCGGKGCKFCKSGWHETGGAGMVHPRVLMNGGVDPKKYSGFAFGWGVERTFLMKSGIGIGDLRTMYSTDLRYLRQY